MNPISITSMSTPDAVEAPRDRRPPRSRTAGPRTGRSVVGAVGAVVGALVGGGLGALAASSMGPCARAAAAPARSAKAKNNAKYRLPLTRPAYRTALFGDA